MHRGEILFFSNIYFKMAIKYIEVKVDIQKGPWGLKEKVTINVFIASN